jgi:hypothetical protein
MLPQTTLTGNHKREIKARCGRWAYCRGSTCHVCGRKSKGACYRFTNVRLQIRICRGCALLLLYDFMTLCEYWPEYPAEIQHAAELTQDAPLEALTKTVYRQYQGMETAMRSRYRKGITAILKHLRELERQEAQLDF